MPGLLVLALAATLQGSTSDLAQGEGRELVQSACTGCHTAEIIVASRMTRKNWDATLTWMEETQGLTRLEPSLRKAILDYLENTQGLEGAEEGETSSPWASPRYRPNPIW